MREWDNALRYFKWNLRRATNYCPKETLVTVFQRVMNELLIGMADGLLSDVVKISW